ncbi:atrial natriuretic peptide-converting enzyme [Anoplophora glabripennis]|uniref:atrial natriuretic peptide-converting enzyme n=1 Tax=Anoplophora glabripennis TaxID=217634 RepID=UPI0008756BC1|nr:atrial natriuretic peptide-converting enzyme [Anoplophora glabripennis]XP_023309771.1 atrial natriuretic peptide-converting enzyme [Anoplophora glabripennis]
MTISMEHKNQRKNSWESGKMSMSSAGTANRHFRRSPSSILSSDSDIRFTRKKLTSQYRCGCCIIATFLLLLLLAAFAVYIGYTFFLPQYPDEQIFRATFRVIDGDFFTSELADPSTNQFKNRSKDYRERLNLLFRRSSVKHGYLGTEVLALDGTENEDLIVHFNIHIDPAYVSIQAKDLEAILSNEISVEESLFFKNLTIDTKSLEVHPSNVLPQVTSTTPPTTTFSQIVTQTPPPPRKCHPLQLEYCRKLPYNLTTYPNILKHKTLKDVSEDVITFRELVDAECYRHAYEFVCQVLQPSCRKGEEEDEIILPCRSFCRDFIAGCGSRLTGRFKDLLDCNRFPEYGVEGMCLTKPGCVDELQSRALSPRICDGVVDCQDISDEKTCTYCPKNQLHCGIGRACIPRSGRCDGRLDCPDGSDERACLSLSQSVASMKKMEVVTPHLAKYSSEGYVVFNEKGEVGKLCTENINQSLPVNQTAAVLHSVASSLCKTLTYQKVLSVGVEIDTESNVSYVKMKDPTAPEINFIRALCPSKQVLKVSCSDLDCGIQSTHGPSGFDTLSKMAVHGDWPWHVALFKEDVHICDGTLISPEWVATTTSCFQGQPKAEWTAKFGSIRLSSLTPWEQDRRIVGMVKSPVEGSTIALVKLDQPATLNDFVRPICLPKQNMLINPKESQCNTLGWARNREQLQRVQVKVMEMEKCENISISTVNSLCTETIYGQNDCNEEEFAGSSMMCQEKSGKWTLVGITNWRIACSKKGTERPRMYDKIASNVNWIRESITSTDTT